MESRKLSTVVEATRASSPADQPPSSPPRAQICDVIHARALHYCHDVIVEEMLAFRIEEIHAVRNGEILPLKTA